MYILKNNNEIMATATDYQAIKDAKYILNIQDATIEKSKEEIVLKNNNFYPKSEWEKYKESDEYQYISAKEKAAAEIALLKEELLSEDYKIIKTIEAQLKNEEPPYNTEELLQKRKDTRFRINELQHLFS